MLNSRRAYQNGGTLPFKLNSEFDPQGDQPQAIEKIVKGVKKESVIKRF